MNVKSKESPNDTIVTLSEEFEEISNQQAIALRTEAIIQGGPLGINQNSEQED